MPRTLLTSLTLATLAAACADAPEPLTLDDACDTVAATTCELAHECGDVSDVAACYDRANAACLERGIVLNVWPECEARLDGMTCDNVSNWFANVCWVQR